MRGPVAAAGHTSPSSHSGAERPSGGFFRLAGRLLALSSEDPLLPAEVEHLLGPPLPGPLEGAALVARVTLGAGGFAHLHLQMSDPAHLVPADLLLAAGTPDFPFDLLEAAGARAVFARRGEREPALLVEGGDVRLRMVEGWRKALGLLLLQRLMRSRADAVFFHAASVALRGRALLLVGPKGAGKSTLALALAARGHALLGDENACYLPATHEVLPFRRPVGVKPGPRSAAVEARLRALDRLPERDGMMRLPADDLAAPGDEGPRPLGAVVFLDGFAPASRLRALAPARADVGRLQPVGASMVNAPRTRRVFEMARLLAQSAVYELTAGPPDAAAATLEEGVFAA
jgi:hypothetical protein